MPIWRTPSRRVCMCLLAALSVLLTTGSTSYTVRPGDTLSSIAVRHGVRASRLAAVNRIPDADVILTGAVLRVPGHAGAGTTTTSSYTVRAGDTLSGISARTGVGVGKLVRRNGLSSRHRIYLGQRLHIPGATTLLGPASRSSAVADSSDVATVIERVAADWDWSSSFVKALAWQESGWNNAVTSSAGAVGVMQVLPSTGDFVSRYVVGRPLDLHAVEDNVTAGVAFLDYLYGLTDRDARRTLGGYYQGLRSIRRNGVYPDTRRYIANVLALKRRF